MYRHAFLMPATIVIICVILGICSFAHFSNSRMSNVIAATDRDDQIYHQVYQLVADCVLAIGDHPSHSGHASEAQLISDHLSRLAEAEPVAVRARLCRIVETCDVHTSTKAYCIALCLGGEAPLAAQYLDFADSQCTEEELREVKYRWANHIRSLRFR